MIAQVRRFNRRYTQRVGALETHYLARDRPLGEARVLWEIGDDGRDVKELRQQLDLDSGYLSRLLRSLEAAGLIAVGPSPADGRVVSLSYGCGGHSEAAVMPKPPKPAPHALDTMQVDEYLLRPARDGGSVPAEPDAPSEDLGHS